VANNCPPDEQAWLCNPYLNAIFRPTASVTSLAPVVREYQRGRRWWSGPFRRAYLAAATRAPTATWLTRTRIGVAPPLEHADQVVVLGGNHRLRLLDGRTRVAHVIAKAGVAPAFLRAELALREAAPDLPIPRLVRVGEGGSWFSEELVDGTPLNRLPEASRRARALGVARSALERLARRTLAAIPMADHVGRLLSDLEDGTARARLFAERRDPVRRLGHALAAAARKSPGREWIMTAQTHGDFQPGNVLVEGETVWLIDWEYTGRRQSSFDLFTYGLAARFPAGLARRVHEAVVGEATGSLELLPGWPGVEWRTLDTRRRALAIFLLEELLVRVREHASPRLHALTPGTLRFLAELDAATACLEEQ
jgi:aminoglycoside phosphotransferase